MKFLVLLTLLAMALAAPVLVAADSPGFELKDGDRIAFIGNTFVERDQNGVYIETALLSRFPDRNITFRNLGYSGDTATGEARGLCSGWSQFEKADKAFERLRKLVAQYKPTVLLINYGMTESFYGPDKLSDFVGSYNKMLDALSAAAGDSPRCVLMSPNFHEDLGKPLPDPSAHDKNLRLYSDAISDIAAKRGCVFIDLFSLTQSAAKEPPSVPLTWNGIHLTPYGYWRVSLALEQALGYPPREWSVVINASGQVDGAKGTKVSDVKASGAEVSFTTTDEMLPISAPPKELPQSVREGQVGLPGTERILTVKGLQPGSYEIKAGDDLVAKASAQDLANGVHITAGPAAIQVDALRSVIAAKDFNYFAYQRPDNDSYILAFRKREQGRNAVEIPQFLPLVEEKEKQIAELKVPKPVTYTISAAK